MSKSKIFYRLNEVKKFLKLWEKFSVCDHRICRQFLPNSFRHPQENKKNLCSGESKLQKCFRVTSVKSNNLEEHFRFQRDSLRNDHQTILGTIPVIPFQYLAKSSLNKQNIYYNSLQLNDNSFSQSTCRKLSTDTPGLNNKEPIGDHLEHVYNRLRIMLPLFFVQPHDYSIYHKDVEFINNIRGTTSRGLAPYVQQLSWMKIIAHLKFAYVKMEILKITKRPENNSIIVRWSIRGVSGLKVMFQFWRYKPWELRKIIDRETSWYDGISTFYLGNDGLVHQHVCDKVIPDEDHTPQMPSPLI